MERCAMSIVQCLQLQNLGSVGNVVYMSLSKVYFQCECAHFQKKNFKNFILK